MVVASAILPAINGTNAPPDIAVKINPESSILLW